MISDVAQAAALPADITREIRKTFPKAAILISTPCRIGEDKLESYGLIANSNNREETPLRAFLAFKKDRTWKVNEVDRRIESSKGLDDNFLKDFWTSKGFEKEYQIRCTTPATDADINQIERRVFEGIYKERRARPSSLLSSKFAIQQLGVHDFR